VSNSLPPVNADKIYDAVLQAWECAFAGMKVVYLSGPITTGRHLVELTREGRSEYMTVVNANSAALSTAAFRLRQMRAEVVVEPASLHIGGWNQSDYTRLWEFFIKRYAKLVIFMPNWEFSAGCAMEFACAAEVGVATESFDGTPVSALDALKMLDAARVEIARDCKDPVLARLQQSLGAAMARIEASRAQRRNR
jgi:hypothetical protein